jgi:hypothetical protein
VAVTLLAALTRCRWQGLLAQHRPHRLVAHAELRGQFTQRAVAGFRADRLDLLR